MYTVFLGDLKLLKYQKYWLVKLRLEQLSNILTNNCVFGLIVRPMAFTEDTKMHCTFSKSSREYFKYTKNITWQAE